MPIKFRFVSPKNADLAHYVSKLVLKTKVVAYLLDASLSNIEMTSLVSFKKIRVAEVSMEEIQLPSKVVVEQISVVVNHSRPPFKG